MLCYIQVVYCYIITVTHLIIDIYFKYAHQKEVLITIYGVCNEFLNLT